jgi:hypothetical protein
MSWNICTPALFPFRFVKWMVVEDIVQTTRNINFQVTDYTAAA